MAINQNEIHHCYCVSRENCTYFFYRETHSHYPGQLYTVEKVISQQLTNIQRSNTSLSYPHESVVQFINEIFDKIQLRLDDWDHFSECTASTQNWDFFC